MHACVLLQEYLCASVLSACYFTMHATSYHTIIQIKSALRAYGTIIYHKLE